MKDHNVVPTEVTPRRLYWSVSSRIESGKGNLRSGCKGKFPIVETNKEPLGVIGLRTGFDFTPTT